MAELRRTDRHSFFQKQAIGDEHALVPAVGKQLELLLASVDIREAADIYDEWSTAEIIIGKKARRGSARLGRRLW